MKSSGVLVQSGILQLEKPKGRPEVQASSAQMKPKYVGGLRLNPGQINKQNVEMDDDMVDPENEDSFEDDQSAEDDQALQIGGGRKQYQQVKPPVELDDDFDHNADLSRMTLQQQLVWNKMKMARKQREKENEAQKNKVQPQLRRQNYVNAEQKEEENLPSPKMDEKNNMNRKMFAPPRAPAPPKVEDKPLAKHQKPGLNPSGAGQQLRQQVVGDKPLAKKDQAPDEPKIEKVVAPQVAVPAPKQEPKRQMPQQQKPDPDGLDDFNPKADLSQMTLQQQLVWNKKRMLVKQREREAREADPNYVPPERKPIVKKEKKPVEVKNEYAFDDQAKVIEIQKILDDKDAEVQAQELNSPKQNKPDNSSMMRNYNSEQKLLKSGLKPLDIEKVNKNNNQNQPDSARQSNQQSSVRRREFKFDAVWENDQVDDYDINLEFQQFNNNQADAAQKKEEKKNGAEPNDIKSRISQISSPRSLKSYRSSSLRSQKSIKRAPMTKCEVLKFLFQLLGANVSLINNVCDILYVYSMKFENNLIFNLISIFILVRVGVKISIFLGQFTMDLIEKFKNNQNQKDDDISISKADPLKDGRANGAIIIMLYTGYYRILQRNELSQRSQGYLMELLLSLAPMSILQILNNSDFYTPNSQFQDWAIRIKLLCFCLLVVEVIITIVRDRKIEPLIFSRKEKAINRNKIQGAAILSLVLFMALLCGGAFILESPACKERQSLQARVCVNCQDKYCRNCDSDPNICEQCDLGYALKADGRCQYCNSQGKEGCLSCKLDKNGNQQCLQCADGYRLQDGACRLCLEGHCTKCNTNQCIQCKNGYYLSNGACKKCTDTLSNCAECAGPYRCNRCATDENMYLDYNAGKCKKCTDTLRFCDKCSNPSKCDVCSPDVSVLNGNTCIMECREDHGWTLNVAQQQCTCENFLNKNNKNKCQTCSEILPNCDSCKTTTKDPGNNYSIKIDKTNTVMCLKCKAGTFGFDKCQTCEESFPGCNDCTVNGNWGECTGCAEGYFISSSTCKKCTYWHEKCEKCNADGCAGCNSGYWHIAGYGCAKAWF